MSWGHSMGYPMPNLLVQAINRDDADRAAKIIQDALGNRIRRRRQLLLPEELAGRSRAARPNHRRMAADRGAFRNLDDSCRAVLQFLINRRR